MTRFAAQAQRTPGRKQGTAPDHASGLHGAARRINQPLQAQTLMENAVERKADHVVKLGSKLHQSGSAEDKAAALTLTSSRSTLSPSIQAYFESRFRSGGIILHDERSDASAHHDNGARVSGVGGASVFSGAIQRKPAVGDVNDPLETEADRVADQASRNQALREAESTSLRALQAAPRIVREVLASSGEPLDPAARTYFEPRFGYDFSRVRVHADNRAAESLRSLNAKAYTFGHHVVMPDSGRTSGSSPRLLLAHELAHVVQQSRGGSTPDLTTSAPHEQEAHAAAMAVAIGLPSVRITCNTGIGVARSNGDDPSEGPHPTEDPTLLADLHEELVADQQELANASAVRDILVENGIPLTGVPVNANLSPSAARGLLERVVKKGGPYAKEAEPILNELRSIQGHLELVSRRRGLLKMSGGEAEGTGKIKPQTGKIKPAGKIGPEKGGREIASTAPESTGTEQAGTEAAEKAITQATAKVEQAAADTATKPTAPPVAESPPIESPFPGAGMPEPVPEPPISIGARLRAAPASLAKGFAEGLKTAFSAENVAAEIPLVVLAIADRVAVREAIRNIKVKFLKEGFAKGVAAGVMGWHAAEVASNLKNRVTPFRVRGLEDPAGILTIEYILKLAEAHENYAVDVGYRFGSSKSLAWKSDIRDKGLAALKKYDYSFGSDEHVLFEYDFIDKLAWVLHPTTDPIVEQAIEKSDEREEQRKLREEIKFERSIRPGSEG